VACFCRNADPRVHLANVSICPKSAFAARMAPQLGPPNGLFGSCVLIRRFPAPRSASPSWPASFEQGLHIECCHTIEVIREL